MKKPSRKNTKKPTILIITIAFLTLAVILNTAFSVYLLRTKETNNNFNLVYLINQAAGNINSPLPIEPVSGKAYISAAKLTLPPNDNSFGQVVYRYESGVESDYPPELNLASKNNITAAQSSVLGTANVSSNFEAIFEKVPNLQACTRGITIIFQARDGEKPAATKQLSNGKTAYFYTEPDCPNPQLFDYAKQIDSY